MDSNPVLAGPRSWYTRGRLQNTFVNTLGCFRFLRFSTLIAFGRQSCDGSLRYEVDLSADALAVTLHVTNPGEEAFDFQV